VYVITTEIYSDDTTEKEYYVKENGWWYSLTNEEAHAVNRWVELEEEPADENELDNAAEACLEALDVLGGAEYDLEHKYNYTMEMNEKLSNARYDAATKVIECGRNLEDILNNADADYLIDEYDGSGYAVWMTEKYTVVKFLNNEEFSRYRCYLNPFAGVVEWMNEVGENKWAFDDGEKHIPADLIDGVLDEIYICKR
jgi:hypothetical protein